jgi:sec-independent protein translocase protein TatC
MDQSVNTIPATNRTGALRVTTPKKEKPAGKKKIQPAKKRPDKKKKTLKESFPAHDTAEQAADRTAPAPGDTADRAPAGRRKPKDLVQTLVDYAEAEESGALVKKQKEEEIDPRALDRGDVPMTVVGHLDELRSRLIISLITIVILTVGAFIFSDEVLTYLTHPFTATGFKLNIFKLTEGFMIRLKVSAILAILAGLPFIMWQGWRFILPAITKRDRMFSRISLMAAILLFYAGVVFVFYLLVPFTVKMLLSFVTKDMISTIGANDYISLVFFFCMIMGILFELPIIMMILTRIGMITPSFLVSRRKYAFVLAFVIAAVITPTQDMLTMIIVGVPLVILYEASIIVSKFTIVRKKKKELEESE